MAGTPTITIELPEKTHQAFGRTKPKGLVLLDVDGHESRFYVPVAVARALKSKNDKGELEVEGYRDLKDIIESISSDCAWKRLLNLIDLRDYSAQEADEKLRLDGYSEQVRASTVERGRSCHLIDDSRFGEFFIRGKISAGWGMDRISRELERRGVDPSTIPGWPDEYFSDENEYERARAIALRTHLSGKDDFPRIMRALSSKGFPSSIAYRVARDLADED